MSGWEIAFWVLLGWNLGGALFVVSALCLGKRKGRAS